MLREDGSHERCFLSGTRASPGQQGEAGQDKRQRRGFRHEYVSAAPGLYGSSCPSRNPVSRACAFTRHTSRTWCERRAWRISRKCVAANTSGDRWIPNEHAGRRRGLRRTRRSPQGATATENTPVAAGGDRYGRGSACRSWLRQDASHPRAGAWGSWGVLALGARWRRWRVGVGGRL